LFRIFSTPEYTASVVLAPTLSSDNISDKLASLSGLGGFASALGLRGGKSVSSNDRFMYLIRSSNLAEFQIEHRGILQILFPDRWDSEHKAWKPRSGTAAIKGWLAWLSGNRIADPPDAYAVVKEYDEHLDVKRVVAASSVVEETGMMSLTYTDTDPTRAANVLRFIVQDANEMLRREAAQRATIQAAYLRAKLADVSVQDYRETLGKLLSEQEQTLMLTNSKLPFAAEPVSDIAAPPLRNPTRALLFGFIAGALGFCLAYFLAIVFYNLHGGAQLQHTFARTAPGMASSVKSLFSSRRPLGPAN
jgi:hypothetical protein